ncbi:MAG TPA: haloacid dehalogenase type II [Gemmatimonadaceae bacterium]|nr:haloacid dehalogenase type II [Gemmatimonadaceae bacterium]
MSLPVTRRTFVATAIGGAAATAGLGALSAPTGQPRIKALLFDAFPIFDASPVTALADRFFGNLGAQLSAEWRTRQFEYTWLRTAAGRYADFWQVTGDALDFASHKVGVSPSVEQRDALMNAYLEVSMWPDAPAALGSLRRAGLRLAFLSNWTPRMLDANVRRANASDTFEHVLSTDRAKTFKPDPRAYQLGIDALRLDRASILFVAGAGWDASGAKLFGYPTFWVNRQRLPAEVLGVQADGSGSTLTDLVSFLRLE